MSTLTLLGNIQGPEGDPGTGVVDTVQPTSSTMALELSDGTTTTPVALPAGPPGPPGGVNEVAGLQGEPSAQQLVDAIQGPLSAQIVEALQDDEVIGDAVTEFVNTNGVVSISGPNIITVTNSLLTQGRGLSPRRDVGAYIAAVTGLQVFNAGVGGETAAGILARWGSNPYMLTPQGGSIPASGGVTVTFKTAAGETAWPLLQPWGEPGLGQTLVGYVRLPNGTKVPGTLSITQVTPGSSSHNPGDVYTFTRATAGDAIPLAGPVPLIVDFTEAHLRDLVVFDVFYNDLGGATTAQIDGIFDELIAARARLKAVDRRSLVLLPHVGFGDGGSSTRMANTTYARDKGRRLFGREAIDVHAYFVTSGLADAGISPTSTDDSDIAAGWVPRSLLASDGIHYPDPVTTGIKTREILGKFILSRMYELGWMATPNTVPGVVTGLTATAGSAEVALSWTAPDSGGSAITDYLVQRKLTSDSTWTTVAHAASTATSRTVTGLTNGSGYDFRVAAVNAIGTGAYSATASATPTSPLPSLGLTGLDHRYDAQKVLSTSPEPALNTTITGWYDSGPAAEPASRSTGTGTGQVLEENGMRFVRLAVGSSVAVAIGRAWADTSKPRTLSAVVRMSALTVYALQMCGYRVRQISTGWELSNGTDTIVVAGGVNTWVHLVARFDGANTKLHVNALTGSASTAFAPSASVGAPTGFSVGTGSTSVAINVDFAYIASAPRYISDSDLAAHQAAVATSYDPLLP